MPGKKNDGGKPRWDLLPWDAVEQIVLVLTFGATKYEDRNWEAGIRYGRVFAAIVRHMWTWFMAKVTGNSDKDPETGFSHLAHAGCGILFLLSYELRGVSKFDDRPLTAGKKCKSKIKTIGKKQYQLITPG
jgi:hypothetical protein